MGSPSKKIKFMMPLSKQEDFYVPEFCEETVSIATTEFSNHPDQAAADEELKNNKKVAGENTNDVFVKPATPPPINSTEAETIATNSNADNRNETETNENITSTEDEDTGSEFEKIEP